MHLSRREEACIRVEVPGKKLGGERWFYRKVYIFSQREERRPLIIPGRKSQVLAKVPLLLHSKT